MLFGGTPFSVVQYSLLKGTLSLDTRHYFQASFSVHFNPQYLGGSVGGIQSYFFHLISKTILLGILHHLQVISLSKVWTWQQQSITTMADRPLQCPNQLDQLGHSLL